MNSDAKNIFAQNKEQWKGYTVFHIQGVKMYTLTDAKNVLDKELKLQSQEIFKEIEEDVESIPLCDEGSTYNVAKRIIEKNKKKWCGDE